MDKNNIADSSLWTVSDPVTVGPCGEKKESEMVDTQIGRSSMEQSEVREYHYQYLYIEDEDDERK